MFFLPYCFITTHYSVLVKSVEELIQSSESEMEDLVEEPASKKSRREAREERRSKAWLKEDEDIVDFLDPSAARKVVGKGFCICSLCLFVNVDTNPLAKFETSLITAIVMMLLNSFVSVLKCYVLVFSFDASSSYIVLPLIHHVA